MSSSTAAMASSWPSEGEATDDAPRAVRSPQERYDIVPYPRRSLLTAAHDRSDELAKKFIQRLTAGRLSAHIHRTQRARYANANTICVRL
jgi:hypothetical protein